MLNKKNLTFSFVFLSAIFLSSCSLEYYMKKGKLNENNFTEIVPFEYSNDLIIVSAELGGKTRRFLFDSGAPNVISDELQEELKFEVKLSNGTTDSQGGRSILDFVYLEDLLIGKVEFDKSIAAVANLKSSPELSCLNIDGIIGSNLMAKCNWEIDYQEKTITFTDNKKTSLCENHDIALPFYQNFQKTPHVNFGLGSEEMKNVTFDLGSSGGISVKINDIKNSFRQIKSYGWVSVSLYGPAFDTIYYRYANPLILGNQSLGPYWVKTSAKSTRNIGNEVWQNFRVGLNYSDKTIYLKKVNDVNASLNGFGFSIRFDGDQWLVSSVIMESSAFDEGMRPGDRVLDMNGINLSDASFEDYCRMFMDKKLIPDGNDLSITIVSKESGEEMFIELFREELFTY